MVAGNWVVAGGSNTTSRNTHHRLYTASSCEGSSGGEATSPEPDHDKSPIGTVNRGSTTFENDAFLDVGTCDRLDSPPWPVRTCMDIFNTKKSPDCCHLDGRPCILSCDFPRTDSI